MCHLARCHPAGCHLEGCHLAGCHLAGCHLAASHLARCHLEACLRQAYHPEWPRGLAASHPQAFRRPTVFHQAWFHPEVFHPAPFHLAVCPLEACHLAVSLVSPPASWDLLVPCPPSSPPGPKDNSSAYPELWPRVACRQPSRPVEVLAAQEDEGCVGRAHLGPERLAAG